MRLIDIQAGGGTVVIGQAAAIPRILRNADQAAERDHALFALWRNSAAADQVRRAWRHLVPGTDLHACSDAQLGELFAAALAARQLRAIFLKVQLRSVAPVSLPQDNHRVLHLEHAGKTVLIAPAGQLPAAFRQHLDAKQAAELVGAIGDRHPQAKSLARQAGRVVQSGAAQAKASSVSRLIAQLIEAGVLEAAVIADPLAIQQAARLGSAPTPVDRLHPYVKAQEALKLSLPQLPAELADVAGSALAMDVGKFVAGAVPLLFVPLEGEIVDPALAGVAYDVLGVPGLDAMWRLIDATCAAGRARREDELDAAGQNLAAAFAAFGPVALAKLREKFLESVTADSGGVAEKPAAPSTPKPTPSPVQQLASAKSQLEKEVKQAKSTVAGLPAAAAAEAANKLAEAKAKAEQAKQQLEDKVAAARAEAKQKLEELEAAAEAKLAEARAEAEKLKQEVEERAKAELAKLEAEAEKLKQAAEERLAEIKEKLAEYEAVAQELRKLAEDNIPGAKEKLAELEAEAEAVKLEAEQRVADAQEKVAEARQEAEQRKQQAEQAADAAENAADSAASAAKSAADDLGNAL